MKVEVRRLSLPFGSFHAGNGMAPHLPFRSGELLEHVEPVPIGTDHREHFTKLRC